MIQAIKVLSLFDGISCGRVALDRAGIPVSEYYASEIDSGAMKISAKNWPEVKQVGNVLDIRAEVVGEVDLLIAGSPCQGFSFAGKQLNFEDPRSKLFFEFVRLKNELNPRFWLLENVKMKSEYKDKISEALGCEPLLINSSNFSAQNRNRLYWTNIPVNDIFDLGISMKDIIDLDPPSRSPEWERFTHRGGIVRQIGRYSAGSQGQRLYCSSGKHPTLCATKTGGAVLPFIEHNGLIGKATKRMIARLQTLPDDYFDGFSYAQASQGAGNGWTVDVVAHIFNGMKENKQ